MEAHIQEHHDSPSSPTTRLPRELACETRVLGTRYRVRTVIGRGHAADVYLGDDLLLERTVAIKIPHHSVLDDPRRREQFRRAAISLAAVQSPHIVGVYDIGVADDAAYLVMQHLEGRTIAEEVRRFGPIAHARAATVLAQVLAGLAAMHAKGLVHGDIRSSNVLFARNGKVVLLDLGIVLDARGASALVGEGTPRERVRVGEETFAHDVYQVGQLVLFMLTGVDSSRRTHRVGFEDLLDKLPVQFAALARRALDTDPARRFASASVMKTEVETALKSDGSPSTTHRHGRERPTVAMTAAQLVSLLVPDVIAKTGE